MGLKDAVNWESDEARENAFETINSSAGDAKAAVNESCDEIKHNLETMKLWTTDQEAIAAIDELLLGNETSRQNQLKEIDTSINTMYDSLQEKVVSKTSAVADAAAQQWQSMNWFERKTSGADTESDYVKQVLDGYKTGYVTPIENGIKDSMDELGTKGSTWATEAMDKILKDSFKNDPVSGEFKIYTDKLSKSAKAALKSVGSDAAEGYKLGTTDGITKVTGAFTKMTNDAIESVRTAQDSHSPSKKYYSLAEDAIDGYELGVKNNFNHIAKVFVDNFTKLFDAIKTLVTQKIKDTSNLLNDFSVSGFNKSLDSITTKAKSVFSSSTWEGYARNVTNSLAKIKIPTFKSIGLSVSFSGYVSADKEKVYKALGLSGWPYLSWYTYASGGFPTEGEMFIAREAGPELVGSIGRKTAVANNDQIVSGIESGVYRAVVAANSTNQGGSQTIRIINEIDGDVVGEKVIQYHNGKVMQTGASPLLV